MDLRGSSFSTGSGLRVSAIPPAPICWLRAVVRPNWAAGANAEVDAMRAESTTNFMVVWWRRVETKSKCMVLWVM